MVDRNPNIEKLATPDPKTELYRFFYLSFKYSQGIPSTQFRIFSWAASSGLLKDVPKAAPNDLMAKLKIPIHHKPLSQMKGVEVAEEWEKPWTQMYSKFQSPGSATPWHHINGITEAMVEKDTFYMSSARLGRPKETSGVVPDSDLDPHASLIRRYALMGQSSGHPFFDRMFSEVSDRIKLREKDLVQNLDGLAMDWESKHPGETFYPKGFR